MLPGARKTFYELSDFPWLNALAENLPAIRQEAAQVMEGYRYLRWRYPQLYDSSLRGMQGQRATFYLEVYGHKVERNRALCPQATRSLKAVPGLVTAGIYLLDAHSKIAPHVGATNVVLRGHMGLICPPGCFLRVGPDRGEWSEGGFLVFDDTVEHEAWNETDDCRAILMFDFFHNNYSEDEKKSHLQTLRQTFLGPKDYVWLKAAGVDCEGEFSQQVLAELETIVSSHGLYFS